MMALKNEVEFWQKKWPSGTVKDFFQTKRVKDITSIFLLLYNNSKEEFREHVLFNSGTRIICSKGKCGLEG